VEKLLEKLTMVEDQIKNECDTDVVMQLEAGVKSIEETQLDMNETLRASSQLWSRKSLTIWKGSC